MTGANPSRRESPQPVEARAALPLVIEQHHAVALREKSRRQRTAHARVVADEIDVRPLAGNMVPQQRAVPRVVVDEHQAHRRELEHAWQAQATQRGRGLFDADQEIPDIRAGRVRCARDPPRLRARCRNRTRATRVRRRSPRARRARSFPHRRWRPHRWSAPSVPSVPAARMRPAVHRRAAVARDAQCQMRIAATAAVTRRAVSRSIRRPTRVHRTRSRAARDELARDRRPHRRRNALARASSIEAVRTRGVAHRAHRDVDVGDDVPLDAVARSRHRALTTRSRSRRDRRRARRR